MEGRSDGIFLQKEKKRLEVERKIYFRREPGALEGRNGDWTLLKCTAVLERWLIG